MDKIDISQYNLRCITWPSKRMSKPKIIPKVLKPRDEEFRECVDLVPIISNFTHPIRQPLSPKYLLFIFIYLSIVANPLTRETFFPN